MAGTVKKSQVATTKKFSYKYADLATVQQFLADNQMDYYQYIDRLDGDDYIMTVRIINGEEKPPLRGCRVIQTKEALVGEGEYRNPAQEQGMSITYARRYSLLMAFGIATEDDDAVSLSRPANQSGDAVPYERKASGKQVGYINSLITDQAKSDAVMNYLKGKNVSNLSELTSKQASELIEIIKGA